MDRGNGSNNVGKIAPEDMTHDVWDYIFFKNAPLPKSSKISKDVLLKVFCQFTNGRSDKRSF